MADFAVHPRLYDLVFAEAATTRAARGVSAGTAVFLTTKMFFEYRGAIFWKTAAGMGDIVFAPLYQALRRPGRDVRVLPSRRPAAPFAGRDRAIEP